MAVHERRFVRRDFHFEHANVLVLEGLVMMGFSSDLDFVLSEGKGRKDENCQFRKRISWQRIVQQLSIIFRACANSFTRSFRETR